MATEGNKEPRKRGCGARLMRGCGWALLILIALVLGCYFVEVYRCSRYTPTGDALFDKYACAVIKRQAWRLFASTWDTEPTLIALDANTLADWEDEFGDDPRYWLLCYSCATDISPAQSAEYIEQGLSEKYYYLDQAIQRDCADVNVLYFAFSEHGDEWWSLAKEHYSSSEQVVTWKDLSPVQQEAIIYSLCDDEIVPWLDKMIDAAPEESYPYYLKARYHFASSDFDQALRDFEAGNAAAINRIPSSFPASLVLTNTDSEDGMDSSCVIGTIVEFFQVVEPLPNFRIYKDIIKESVSIKDLSDDPRWRNAMRDFAVRFGQLRRDEDLYPLVSSVMLMIQTQHFLVEQGGELSREQRHDLLQVNNRVSANVRTLDSHRQRMYLHEEHYWERHVLAKMFAQTMSFKTGDMSFRTGDWYSFWHSHMFEEMMEANADFSASSSSLLEFNYETFRWPEPDDGS